MINQVKNQAALAAANIESKISSAEQSHLISEAVDQMKTATDAIGKVFGAVSSTSTAKAKEISHKVESSISEKPLVSVGIAFAAGWLISRLMKS